MSERRERERRVKGPSQGPPDDGDDDRIDFPNIHERPRGWIEFLLVLAAGYAAGILSFWTCAVRPPWVALVALTVVVTGALLVFWRASRH
jgi:hypothetical protein